MFYSLVHINQLGITLDSGVQYYYNALLAIVNIIHVGI